jgi:hypothetical protein
MQNCSKSGNLVYVAIPSQVWREVSREAVVGQKIYLTWMYSTWVTRDEAFRWLDRAIEERSPRVVFIRVIVELDNIFGLIRDSRQLPTMILMIY